MERTSPYHLPEPIDFAGHNESVRQLWDDFAARRHRRIPVVISGSIRNLLSNPAVNTTGYSFRDFFTKAEAQLNCQLAYQFYTRHNFFCDLEMGLPEKQWAVRLDFQNSYDQAWFGCPFAFFGDTDVPDTTEILKTNPGALYDWDDPDPFWGRGDFMKRAMDVYAEMERICRSGFTFHGLPVKPPVGFPCAGTDGLFDCAVKLRGAVEIMTDMYDNPKYFHDLMDYLARNVIRRMKAHREWIWDHDPDYAGNRRHPGSFGYADDAIAMLSPEQFQTFVLPYMRRIFDEFYDGSGCSIHLCGKATHHFKFLADTFHVIAFDTGFPVDHGGLRRELGPDIRINGGPTIMTVKDGPSAAIEAEVERICASGVLEGGLFVLIAANNLAPCTPVAHLRALYEAGKRFGRV